MPGLLDLLVEDDLNQALVISGDPRLNTNGTTRSIVKSILTRPWCPLPH